ncbi:MAG TPA: hypothetical protein VGD77_00695 [Gemmatimonadaceae bacterium]
MSPSPAPSTRRPPRIACGDVNTMFVTCARLADPEGVGREPLLIVGGGGGRGVVTSASYEVRAYGVRAGMPMARARRLCPQAVVVPVPGAMVREKSAAIEAVFARWAPRVEMTSVDEGLLDFSGTEDSVYRDRSFAALLQELRAALVEETGLTVSFGGATNAMVAKMASELAKPARGCDTGVLVVAPGEEAAFMAERLLAEIPGVGPKSQARFAAAGLVTVRDVLGWSEAALVASFGEREGRSLAAWARGESARGVEDGEPSRSMGRAETFETDLDTGVAIETELLRLVGRVAGEMRDEGLRARNVRVTLRDRDFTTRQAQRTLDEPLSADGAIFGVARELLQRLRRARPMPARLVGVTLSRFVRDGEPSGRPATQLGLFESAPAAPRESERDRRLMEAVDAVRHRFGRDAVKPAALANHVTEDSPDKLRNPFGGSRGRG